MKKTLSNLIYEHQLVNARYFYIPFANCNHDSDVLYSIQELGGGEILISIYSRIDDKSNSTFPNKRIWDEISIKLFSKK